ncbi:MAG TPA: ABC transporter permease [Candidatus Angelobacter sp.]|nr:ABC transporter permease [Candidatus Angelobacter sp.]
MSTLFQDLRYAARMLLRAPGFTAIAMITLALGIGANTALFSVINATLLRPVPYPDADRMVFVWQTYGSDPNNINIVSALNIWDIQKQNTVLESIGMFDSAGKGYNLGGANQPERVSGVRVSAKFFDVLGIRPLLGRTFFPEEEVQGKDHEVVLTYGLWQRRFGGDPVIVGKQIQVDGASHTVVGVMPRQFEFQFWSRERQLFVPAGYTKGDREDRAGNSFVAIARLKPGVTLAQAKAELNTIGKRLAQQYPSEDARMSATVTPLLHFEMEDLQTTSLALLVAVGFVLLIACVNVANLLLARGASRQKELAIRLALGATRRRIVRQLITESVLLGLLGGAAGLLVAAFGLNLFMPFLPAGLHSLPFRQVGAIAIDGRVFLFALSLSGVAGILFGLAPALGTRSCHLVDPLKEGGRGLTSSGGNRLRHTLVAAELALALVVLAGAGLMIDSMARLMGVNPGLNPKNVLVMGVSTAQENAYYSPPVDAQFCEEMTQQIGAISGVESVSAVAHLPLGGGGAGRGFTIEGRPATALGEQPGAEYSVACPNFLRTMGIPILEGREFTDADTATAAGVVVINQAMARRYWPKEDALGKHIRIGGVNSTEPWLSIVGISADFRHDGLDQKPRPSFLRPFTQAAWPTMTVVLRTASAPAAFEKPVREALARLGDKYPPSNMNTMEQIVTDSLGSRRFPMFLLSAFAVLALLLSAVGIAGVVGYSVVQRTHELGIRMALGAQQGDILKLVLGRSMLWTLGGVAAGILGAIGLTRLLSSLLYDVKPADPLILGGTAALLTLVALAACYVPARRAMKVDPMVALRYE